MKIQTIGVIGLALLTTSVAANAQYNSDVEYRLQQLERQQRDQLRDQERRLDRMQQDIEDQAYRQMDAERQRKIDRALDELDPSTSYLRR